MIKFDEVEYRGNLTKQISKYVSGLSGENTS